MFPELIHKFRGGIVGVECLPNHEASDLERHLGIQFPERPYKALINKRNTLAYAADALFLSFPPRIPELIGLIASQTTDPALGFYLDSSNIFFTTGSNLYVAHHENMHGFMYQINPLIRSVQNRYTLSVIGRFIGISQTPDPMPPMILKCFNEGMADWAAIQTGLKIGGGIASEAYRGHIYLSGDSGRRARRLGINRTKVKTQLVDLEDAISLTADALELRSNLGRDMLNRAMRITSGYLIYSTGYHFVFDAMNALKDKNITTGDGLVLLIKNPPTKLQAFRDPVKYITELLAA